jgi:hypothetical protein
MPGFYSVTPKGATIHINGDPDMPEETRRALGEAMDKLTQGIEPEYYIAGEHEDTERAPFVVICSRWIDGNIADVYGESIEEARDMAQAIVDLLNGST